MSQPEAAPDFFLIPVSQGWHLLTPISPHALVWLKFNFPSLYLEALFLTSARIQDFSTAEEVCSRARAANLEVVVKTAQEIT